MNKLGAFAFSTIVTTFAIAVAACAGAGDDGTNSGGNALSSSRVPTSADAGTLQSTDNSVHIADVKLVHDSDHARLIISNKGGICGRVNGALNLDDGEIAFVITASGLNFANGKQTLTGTKTGLHGTMLDNSACISGAGLDAGPLKGTLTIASSSGGSVAGSMDVTVGTVHLVGTFNTAGGCATGTVTNGLANCFDGDVGADGGTDFSDGGTDFSDGGTGFSDGSAYPGF